MPAAVGIDCASMGPRLYIDCNCLCDPVAWLDLRAPVTLSTDRARKGSTYAVRPTRGGLARLIHDGAQTKAEKVYFTRQMKNQHGGVVLIDGYVYGANDLGSLVCLEFKTGKIMWEARRAGKGSISYTDCRLYYRNEGAR